MITKSPVWQRRPGVRHLVVHLLLGPRTQGNVLWSVFYLNLTISI